jgi:hypothetical protein
MLKTYVTAFLADDFVTEMLQNPDELCRRDIAR